MFTIKTIKGKTVFMHIIFSADEKLMLVEAKEGYVPDDATLMVESAKVPMYIFVPVLENIRIVEDKATFIQEPKPFPSKDAAEHYINNIISPLFSDTD